MGNGWLAEYATDFTGRDGAIVAGRVYSKTYIPISPAAFRAALGLDRPAGVCEGTCELSGPCKVASPEGLGGDAVPNG